MIKLRGLLRGVVGVLRFRAEVLRAVSRGFERGGKVQGLGLRV